MIMEIKVKFTVYRFDIDVSCCMSCGQYRYKNADFFQEILAFYKKMRNFRNDVPVVLVGTQGLCLLKGHSKAASVYIQTCLIFIWCWQLVLLIESCQVFVSSRYFL